MYSPGPPQDLPEGSPAGATPAEEHQHLAGLLVQGTGGGWRSSAPIADFYAAKGLVEAVFGAAGLELAVEPGARPFLHAGRTAEVSVAGHGRVGWIGELHPLVAREWDLDGAAAFELDFDALAEAAPGPVAYADVTRFPAVLQDIAVTVARSVSADRVMAAVREGAGGLLADAEVFDVYEGEQVGAGNRSLALRLAFRAPDRTLTDDEVAERRTSIESALDAIGGKLRA